MTLVIAHNNSVNNFDAARLRPVFLLLLDGWGVAPSSEANAIRSAKIPVWLNLIKEYPVGILNPGQETLNARYLTLGTGQALNDENQETELTLTKIISAAGKKQIKITETERLAALTHFFNGHNETKAAGEDWLIVSSEAGDHSLKPALALKRITREVLKTIEQEKYDFGVVVVPTVDLVAASGDLKAVKKAVEAVDQSLKKIKEAVLNKRGILIVSSAQGNAERIKNLATEFPDKEMTSNPVPLVIVGEEYKGKTIGLTDPVNNDLSLLQPIGDLADLAPTILEILDLKPGESMTGKSLIDK